MLYVLFGIWHLWPIQPAAADQPVLAQTPTRWQYGGLADLSYALNFNFPENHRFRSKETTPRTNELAPNMVLGYLHRDPHRVGDWGLEVGVQGGYDTEALVPRQSDSGVRPIDGADVLRHLSRANVSYLAPVGNGLLLTAGLMKGYINYESFYTRNNFNYTRAYVTDYSPNFMLGVGGRYAVDPNLDVGFHVLNGFQHLAHANNLPSYGAELDWRVARRVELAQNFYYGPDQMDTSMRFWRAFSDTQLQWRGDDLTVALAYDIGTERATSLMNRRTVWTGAALFTRWDLAGPWSVALRPEWFWDRDGRMTNARQWLWAVTTTLSYQRHIGPQFWITRLEYRYDESRGPEGGFFNNGIVMPGEVKLSRSQHSLFFALLWAFDS